MVSVSFLQGQRVAQMKALRNKSLTIFKAHHNQLIN